MSVKCVSLRLTLGELTILKAILDNRRSEGLAAAILEPELRKQVDDLIERIKGGD